MTLMLFCLLTENQIPDLDDFFQKAAVLNDQSANSSQKQIKAQEYAKNPEIADDGGADFGYLISLIWII